MNNPPPTTSLYLHRVTGPNCESIAIAPKSSLTIGRSRECDVMLDHSAVSRLHLRIEELGGRVVITDLNSTHGTRLNDSIIPRGVPEAIIPEDRLGVGPWTFIASNEPGPPRASTISVDDRGYEATQVQDVHARTLETLAAHRLQLLFEAARMFQECRQEQDLWPCLLDLAMKGTRFAVGAVCRPLFNGSDVEIRHSVGLPIENGRAKISLSLLRAASEGRTVTLRSDPNARTSGSIIEFGITSALCAPVMLDNAVVTTIYLDSRRDSRIDAEESASYCAALTNLASLTLANILRAEMSTRQALLEYELKCAHDAQICLMPPAKGGVGSLQYSSILKPGAVVAGDVLDVIPLSGDRLGIVVGDVVGKGMGAGMLTAAVHSLVHCELLRTADPASAISIANRYISGHCRPGEFLSLWVGVMSADGSIDFVDAGHGYAIIRGQAESRVIRSEHGGMIGIDAQFTYHNEHATLAPGEMLVVFTDGLLEQRGASQKQAGWNNVQEWIMALRDIDTGPHQLLDQLTKFAGTVRFADDVTICVVGAGSG